MRINSINYGVAQNTQVLRTRQAKKANGVNSDKMPANTIGISFMGNKKNPKQVLHIAPEGVVCGSGGVRTVINDWIKTFPAYNTEVQHNFVIPYYNGDIVNGQVQVINYNGKHYFLNSDKDISEIGELTPANKAYELKEVASKKMLVPDGNPNGNYQREKTIRLFELQDPENKIIPYKGPNKPKFYMLFTELTGAMRQQYGFSYKDGAMYGAYCEFARGVVDIMPELTEATGGEEKGFNPKHVLIHDYHSSAAMKFIEDAKKSGKDNDYYKDIKLSYIFHNAGAAYQGKDIAPYELFKSIATVEEFQEALKSEEYYEILNGNQEGLQGRLDEFFKNRLSSIRELKNENTYVDSVNPSLIPTRMALEGKATVATVSGEYAREIADPRLEEMSPGLTYDLKKLAGQGRLLGVLNGSAKPNVVINQPTYTADDKAVYFYKNEAGEKVDIPSVKIAPADFSAENPQKAILEKNRAKLEFMRRIYLSQKSTSSKIYEKTIKDGSIKEVGKESLVTGQTTRKATITGNIGENDIKILQARFDAYEANPENPPFMPSLFTSWGRGDFQKGIDEILMAIKSNATKDAIGLSKEDAKNQEEIKKLYLDAYRQKELGKDKEYKEALNKAVNREKELGIIPKPLFAICAGLDGDSDDIKRIRKLIEELSTMPELKGQFAYIDGFGPNDVLGTAADWCIFPSRFAPCELTPIEAHNKGAATIVTNTGGLVQSTLTEEDGKSIVSGLRTENGFFKINHNDLLEREDEIGAAFRKEWAKYEKAVNTKIESERKKHERLGLPIQEKNKLELMQAEKGFSDMITKYRDKVLAKEIGECVEEAIKIDHDYYSTGNKDAKKCQMVSGMLAQKTGWGDNDDLTGMGKSAFGIYSEKFFDNYEDKEEGGVSFTGRGDFINPTSGKNLYDKIENIPLIINKEIEALQWRTGELKGAFDTLNIDKRIEALNLKYKSIKRTGMLAGIASALVASVGLFAGVQAIKSKKDDKKNEEVSFKGNPTFKGNGAEEAFSFITPTGTGEDQHRNIRMVCENIQGKLKNILTDLPKKEEVAKIDNYLRGQEEKILGIEKHVKKLGVISFAITAGLTGLILGNIVKNSKKSKAKDPALMDLSVSTKAGNPLKENVEVKKEEFKKYLV